MLNHRLFHFRFESSAFSDGFHRVKRHLRRNTVIDERVHDIVAAADTGCQRRNARLDDFLRIADPHVRAMGQTGNTNQFLHRRRMRFLQHLSDEPRAEFRHAVCACLGTDLLRRDAQCLRTGKERNDIRIGQRNCPCVNARQVHEHTNHRRVIVSQNVQLDQYVVHRAEIIVRRNDRAGHVVCRMLDGDELLNLVFLRQNDHACRMLTRRSLDADTAQRKPVHLRFGKRQFALLAVFLDVSVRGFIRQRADGSRSIAVALAEQLFNVGVRTRLIDA